MSPSTSAESLADSGRFREALQALGTRGSDPRHIDILRAELLELTGDVGQSRQLAEQLGRAKTLTQSERSRLEFVFSRISAETGDSDAELQHLQKSINLAERCSDLKSLCQGQLRLVALVADRSGPQSVGALMAALRHNVTKLGEPTTTAALHLFVADLDGKRGLIDSGARHTRLSQDLLGLHPNLALEAWAHNNLLAFAILKGDLDQAAAHGRQALRTSTECGSVASLRRCVSNLGRLHLARGQFDDAIEHFNRALTYSSSNNEQVNGTLESLAKAHLAQDRLEEAYSLICRVDTSTQQSTGVGRYVHRHSLLTKAEILLRMRCWQETLDCLDRVVTLASQAADEELNCIALLLKVEVLLHLGQSIPAGVSMRQVMGKLPILSANAYGLYERATAICLVTTGQLATARAHMERAQKTLGGVDTSPAVIELSRSWSLAKERLPLIHETASKQTQLTNAVPELLHSLVALMLHAGRPELLATTLISILETTASAAGAVAIARDEHGREESLAAFGAKPTGDGLHIFALGTSRERSVEVRVRSHGDLESQATLNSLALLVHTVHELERGQDEREERLTLWPSDELPCDDGNALFHGTMQRLMTEARKFAQANISVLITGESGTGKEIVARAIHAHSKQAKRAFVPFNCTAVPRELLESQLFGHRRGAFTGADRDNPGLIRAARDGTLFLDEIGELSLDLQPKLLRFLESGEIHPLGEPTPLKVDVRVIAATNADLEQLVQEGRFREDLFYRLNVIRLTIPPLRERRDEIPGLAHHFVAKAAAEFGKRRVRIGEETMEHLVLYPWPGNVRQLQNEMRRMVAMAEPDSVITRSLLSTSVRQEARQASRGTPGIEIAVPLTDKLTSTLSRVEREMIKVALRANQGRVEAAAKALGISRKGLYLKRQRLGL